VEVLFATSNKHKVTEANLVGKEYDIEFTQVNILYPEIRSNSVAEVAEEGAKYVGAQLERPVVVEDSGIFIDALNGFPGAYSALVYKKIGLPGILKLLDGVKDRHAHFISAVGYKDDNTLVVYEGKVDGIITYMESGDQGFGYDPIFQPVGTGKTFAQDLKAKDKLSHRRKAFEELCSHLKK
jgi:XTP/dITP diphosphohydrolase